MTVDCPSELELRNYVRGGLSRPDHDSVEGHVDDCDSCRATVAGLDGTLPTFPRPIATDEPDDELERLKALVRPLHGSVSNVVDGRRDRDEAPPLEVGSTFAGYEVGEVIGRGGMGWVYRGRHTAMQRDVAIKVLPLATVDGASLRRRFAREIESIARLRHPHVVTAHDAGEADGCAYLVMEYVDGDDLAAILREAGPLPIDEAVDVARQAAEGLAAAHAAGLVHRDVKPANLLLDADGTVRLADLGLARPLEPVAATDLTRSGHVMGTVGYLAPEQAVDPAAAGPPADVYGLGCTLCELLTGQPPFAGETPMAVVLAHREQPIPDPRDLRPDCPTWLADICRSMLAKDPNERLTLAEFRGGEPVMTTVRAEERNSIARFFVPIAAAVLAIMAGIGWSRGWFVSSRVGDSALVDREITTSPRKDGDENDRVRPSPTPPTEGDRTSEIAMVEIPAGEFEMGAADDEKHAAADERPRHRVRITRSFLIGTHEVTLGQWRTVTGGVPNLQPMADSAEENDELPVAGVTWNEAIRFCNALSERHRLPPFYRIADDGTVAIAGGAGFRLPTEAEWEYACRAGTQSAWSFGDDPERLGEFGWFAGNAVGRPRPVGRLKPNAWGLFDVHGNVPEWCWDRYDPEYYGRAEPINPSGSTRGTQRVFRGGSVNDDPARTRSAARHPLGGSYGGFTNPVGLRIVRSLP